ncbi:hypothetical protein JCM10449v2_002910 [Rhodotorula kratochvilovae]
MATYAKGLPASVQHFVHAGDRLADAPLHPHHPLAAAAAFRNDASSSSSVAPPDFAAFHEAQAAQLGSLALDRAWVGAGASTSAPPRADTAPSPHQGPSSDTARIAAHDGAELAGLLSGGGLLDAVDGDWEEELLARQSEAWRVEMETAMPQDPFASTAARTDTKGKGRAGEDAVRAGDMSPTSSELLSSLSSLDLADKAYLRTLLSQDPATAFDDYFSRGSYTDDVYGLPSGVQRLFEKAAQADERVGIEEGRKKALRRLGMVLRHMQASDPVGAVQQQAERMSLSEGEVAQMTGASVAAMAQQAPLQRQQPSFAHAQYAPLHTSHVAAQSAQQSHLFQPSATTSSYGEYTVPSSLSESAFITITPPPRSPAAVLAPAPPAATHAPAPAPEREFDAPAPSTAALLAHHAARLRSSGGGRYGPDWARAVPMQERERELLRPLRGVEEPWEVTEGRTH